MNATCLVLGLLEVLHDLVDELAEEPAADEVVRLHEDLAQPRLPDRVVLRVELVEPVERVPILLIGHEREEKNECLIIVEIGYI